MAATTASCSSSGLPIYYVGSFSQLGASSSTPRHRVDSNNQFIDNFSWKLSKHDLKFGFEFRRTSIQQYFDKYFRGKLTFAPIDATNSVEHGRGSLTRYSKEQWTPILAPFNYNGDSIRHTYQNNFGLYAQDSFHLNSRVTAQLRAAVGLLRSRSGERQSLQQHHQPRPCKPTFYADAGGAARTEPVVPAGLQEFRAAFKCSLGCLRIRDEPLCAADMACSLTRFRRIFSWAFALPAVLRSRAGVQQHRARPDYSSRRHWHDRSRRSVYGAPSCSSVECDVFAFNRNIKTPYMENYNLNIEQQISRRSCCRSAM